VAKREVTGSEATSLAGVIGSTPAALLLITLLTVSSACRPTGATSDETATEPSASSSAPTTPLAESTETTAPDREEVLQSIIDAYAHQSDPVGVAAGALFPDGDMWLGAAGMADVDLGIPLAVTDRFVVGSITKTFMAALTMRLVEEDIVQLDQTVSAHLPGFPSGEKMTLRNLLDHRAGVYDASADLLSREDGPIDPTRVFTPEELLAAAAAGTPTFAPGSNQRYSNAGYWVLGGVLEAATDTDAGSLLDSYVIDPMGLEATLLYDSSLPEVVVANAYEDLDGDNETDSMGTELLPGFFTPTWTAGGMVSTVEDLLVFLSGLFTGGLIEEDSLNEMLDLPEDSVYAMGIYRNGSLWGHDGIIWGYLSQVYHDVDTGVSVAAIVNRSSAPHPEPLAERIAASAGELANS
jgi:D-alanyl-D-alanine carboxypeptidase